MADSSSTENVEQKSLTNQKATTVARLRIEIVTETRIVRRVVDVSNSTSLPMVARIIRRARQWWEDREYQFRFGDRTYTSTKGRGREAMAASTKNTRLGDALGDARSFEFVHNLTTNRRLTVEIMELREATEPETAFPKTVEVAGTLAVEDLTPDDSLHAMIVDADDPESGRQEAARQLCQDEHKRADHDQGRVKTDIDQIRLSRRGALRSHQRGAKRRAGAAGLPPEPETERRRWSTEGTHKPLVLRIGPVDPAPEATTTDNVAYFQDQDGTTHLRLEAWQWTPYETDAPHAQRVKEMAAIARLAPTDLLVVALYGNALETAKEWRNAIDVYHHVIELGRKALPEGFAGQVDTNSDNGGGLMTAIAGAGRCECHWGNRTRGIRLLEQCVVWDEDQNSDAARILASEYIHAGQLDKGRKLIASRKVPFAAHDYDLLLANVQERRWAEAITAARRGLATNPYIGEILLEHRNPMAIPMGDLHNGRSAEDAREYTLHYSWQWKRAKTARALLRWTATHPLVLQELGELRAPDYLAAYEGDGDVKTTLSQKFWAGLDTIEVGRSAMMLANHEKGGPRPWTLIENASRPRTIWD